MSFYKGAKQLILPENATQKTIRPTTIIVHSAGGKGSLYNFWLTGSALECHFWIGEKGQIEQYMSTTTRADANYHANNYAISIETESTVSATERWTPAQAASLVTLIDWLCDAHNIPRNLCTSPNGPGLGWHIMFGSPGPWTPSSKVCPGPARIEQFKTEIVPLVKKAGSLPLKPEHIEAIFMHLSEKEQKEMYLWIKAIFNAIVDNDEAITPNILKRTRDGIARLEKKAA